MDSLKFSICKDPNDPREPYDAMLYRFVQAQARAVQMQDIPWDTYKQEMTAMALYGQGMDVSQVGAPVVNDLVAMNSLRPFSQAEIDRIGGTSAFVPVAWNTMKAGAGNIYSVPWIMDPRAILYWRDMLEEAGVDERDAFSTLDGTEKTFERLQEKGLKTPWAVGTANRLNAFQIACTWIWGLGGDIGREDHILFDQSEAIEALIRYFSLYRFMHQDGRNPEASEVGNWFLERKVAVLMSGASVLALRGTSPEVEANLGVALAPGPTYVGGSSLVIWQNSRQPEKALALVRHLSTHETQLEFAIQTGLFPARLSALNDPHFTEDPHLSVFAQSALQGRTYVNMQLSGLVEDMLSNAISRVWNRIISDPHTNVRSVLMKELEPVARRVRSWLE